MCDERAVVTPHESLVGRVIEKGDQRIVETRDVEQPTGLTVYAELCPGHHFEAVGGRRFARPWARSLCSRVGLAASRLGRNRDDFCRGGSLDPPPTGAKRRAQRSRPTKRRRREAHGRAKRRPAHDQNVRRTPNLATRGASTSSTKLAAATFRRSCPRLVHPSNSRASAAFRSIRRTSGAQRRGQ
jgi:hypothetical protein